jgi:hypothetical protein
MITGFFPVSVTRGRAIEISTLTELEVEVKKGES